MKRLLRVLNRGDWQSLYLCRDCGEIMLTRQVCKGCGSLDLLVTSGRWWFTKPWWKRLFSDKAFIVGHWELNRKATSP